ncbi:hypothetical protein DERP_011289 [Dermatophagoides pteronyssinus]|uniref:Uncharacterized protein n=1 Tax=Dermatophagoides pteronyssinus TaxID=6956 RepID=A0ABQ8J7A7_DERPT|nr:hypothetical protein DERP_011289 [Dermatophagoides pteronyssinus]
MISESSSIKFLVLRFRRRPAVRLIVPCVIIVVINVPNNGINSVPKPMTMIKESRLKNVKRDKINFHFLKIQLF